MKSTISFLCSSSSSSSSSSATNSNKNNYLRGDAYINDNNNNSEGGDEGWKSLDPTCLGNTNGGLIDNKDDCTNQADTNGNACIWCDAPGNDVFGVCATMQDKEFLGTYLNCDANEVVISEDSISEVVVGAPVDFDALFALE